MNQIRSLILVVILSLVRPVHAGPEPRTPLSVVPDSAVVVGRIADPNQTIEDARASVRQIDPHLAQMLPPLPPAIQAVLSSPLLAGASERDWWFALFLPEQSHLSPPWLVIVPTTDYEAFVRSVKEVWPRDGSESIEAIDCSPWSIFVDPAVADRVRACVTGDAPSIASTLNRRSQEHLKEGRISLHARIERIRSHPMYAGLRARVSSMCDGISGFPIIDGVHTAVLEERIRKQALSMIEASDDVRSIAASLSFSNEDMGLEARFEPRENSHVYKCFSAMPGSELKTLRRLPRDQLVYLGLAGNASEWFRWAAGFCLDTLDVETELEAAITDSVEQYASLNIRSRATGFDLGDPSQGVAQWTTLIDVENPQDFRQFQDTFAGVADRFDMCGVDQNVQLLPEAETYGVHKADLCRTNRSFESWDDPLGLSENVTLWMYGREGMVGRIVYLPGTVLKTTGGGSKAMARAIEAYQSAKDEPDETASAFLRTRERLAETPYLMLLFDGPWIFVRVARLLAETAQFPLPFDTTQLQNFDFARSYVGLSVASDQGVLDLGIYIPMEQIRSVFQLVQFFKSHQRPVQSVSKGVEPDYPNFR